MPLYPLSTSSLIMKQTMLVSTQFLLLLTTASYDVDAFQPSRTRSMHMNLPSAAGDEDPTNEGTSTSSSSNVPVSQRRRSVVLSAAGAGGGMFGGIFGGGDNGSASANTGGGGTGSFQSKGPTNEVIKVVKGVKQRRLGGSDIVVSELGLGTQVRNSSACNTCMPKWGVAS